MLVTDVGAIKSSLHKKKYISKYYIKKNTMYNKKKHQ